jgi:DNA modification methylase
MPTLTKAHSVPTTLSPDEPKNELYYGDNLSILRDHILSDSIDLIYLDPPFNSNQDYNVLFTEQDGTRAAAQILAFEDTWQWDQSAAQTYQETVEAGGKVSQVLQALWAFWGGNNMMAYLAMMSPRLVELHRVLKPTGSFYLHCDSTASHYIKLLLDSIFGLHGYRNEIIWRRTPFSGSSKARARQLPRSHDVIFFYTKGDTWTWHAPTLPYSDDYLKRFKWKDARGFYRKTLLKTYSEETLKRLKKEDRLIEPVKQGAMYSYKQYLDESSGERQIDDVWTDINMINPVAKERLGYPTQKPEALLERIIKASSDEGDTILDPFCGCGTAITVAEGLNRKWVGIDITHLAVGLIRHRLQHAYEGSAEYKVIGEPVSLYDAKALAKADPYEFQWWAAGLVGGRIDKKRGADQGIDGRLFFHDDPRPGTTKQIILSVKSGKIPPAHIRELRGVIDREEAEIGVLLTLQAPTKPMRTEAASAGFYSSPWGTKHPRLQIITIEELLEGRRIDYPQSQANVTHRRAVRKAKGEKAQPQRLPYTH